MKLALIQQTYPVTLDHNLSSRDMIAAGEYAWIRYIDELTTVQSTRVENLDIELLVVPKETSRNIDALSAYLMLQKVRLATPEEALAFGAQHQQVQYGQAVVTIFKSFGVEIALLLATDTRGRFARCYGDWQQFCDPFYTFLVVRDQ